MKHKNISMNNLENTDNKEQRAEKSPMGGFPDKPGHGRGRFIRMVFIPLPGERGRGEVVIRVLVPF